MPAAGDTITIGRIPGERIATTEETNDSGSFSTTENVVISVTAPLVTGRTYLVRFIGHWQSTVAGDTATTRIRETNTSGTQHALSKVHIVDTSSFGWPGFMEMEFTAASTGNQTFVATGVRAGGSGNINLVGVGSEPSFLYVNYIRG